VPKIMMRSSWYGTYSRKLYLQARKPIATGKRTRTGM
jgi:hypothetical protein